MHGCGVCHQDQNQLWGQTIQLRRHNTFKRLAAIENEGYEVKKIWTHEIDEMLKTNPAMKTEFSKLEDLSGFKI